MKKLFTICLLLLPTTLLANPCNSISQLKLDESVQMELQQTCITKLQESSKNLVPDILSNKDSVEEFSGKVESVTSNISSLLKTTATDLNIAVNDFIKTPVGMLTAGIITYKYLGKDFIIWVKNLLKLTLFLILSFYTCSKIRKHFMLKSTAKKTMKTWYGREYQKECAEYYTWSESGNAGETAQLMFVFSWILQVLSVIIFVVNI